MTAPEYGYVTQTYYADELEDHENDPETQLSLLNSNVKTDMDLIVKHYPVSNLVVDKNGQIKITSSIGEQYSWLFVLVNDLDENGKATYGTKYAVIQANESPDVVSYTDDDISKPTYEEGDYITKNLPTKDYITVMTSGIVAIPEPTSALLMLLGVAGLSLKRRRV